ncbi:MAG: PEP-CTERM sorting domain-containing protein [Fuerstiella sp.]
MHRGILAGFFGLITSCVGPSAHAGFIEVDLFSSGDGLVTLDTNTGLEWLDVTATVGLSVNDVLGGTGGWTALGFRYAGSDELEQLFLSSAPGSTVSFYAFTANNFAGASLLVDLLGNSLDSPVFPGSQGYVDPGTSDLFSEGTAHASFYQVRISDSTGRFHPTQGSFSLADSSATIGSFLVRDVSAVPEPASMYVFTIGALGLGIAARRRTRRKIVSL